MRKNPELTLEWRGDVTDAHMHMRFFDVKLDTDDDSPTGKSGALKYSETAVRNGITRGLSHLNENLRIANPDALDGTGTSTTPFPIDSAERLEVTSNIAATQSKMKTGLILLAGPQITHLKKDPDVFTVHKIKKEFNDPRIRKLAAALKIFGNQSFGSFNIKLDEIPPTAHEWYKPNPDKPIVLHLEDENVGIVLEDWPDDLPVHIAHVSSTQELEAVIKAKQAGKKVTCEATPHHLFLTEKTSQELGARGCMKPSLKSEEDRKFLWGHIEYIDIIASDCAPHRLEDKVGPDGKDRKDFSPGVTNHDVLLPLFFQAVLEGKLTPEELYEKVVIHPAKIFNLPIDYTTHSKFSLSPITATEAAEYTQYDYNPFLESSETPKMRGRIVNLSTNMGQLAISHGIWTGKAKPRYQNLIQFN
jgi:hypothetical protein